MCGGGGGGGGGGGRRNPTTTAMNNLSSDRYSSEALREANLAYEDKYEALKSAAPALEAPTAPTDEAGGAVTSPEYDKALAVYNEQYAAREKTFTESARAAGVEAADLYLNKYGPRQGTTRIQYQGQINPSQTNAGQGGAGKGGAMAGGTLLTGGTLSTGAKTAKSPTLLGQ